MPRSIILTCTLLIISRFSINAQTLTQYFDGADTLPYQSIRITIGADSVWQIGTPQKVIFNAASTSPNAILTDTTEHYPLNDTSYFVANVLNEFQNFGILAFQWTQKLDLSFNQDWGFLDFSYDNGATWENAFNNPLVYNFYGFDVNNVQFHPTLGEAFTGTDSSWSNIWICFDLSWVSTVTDTLKFRYTIISDSIESNQEGWMIDNMIAGYTWIHTLPENTPLGYMQATPNPTTGVIDINTKKVNEFQIIEEINLLNLNGQVLKKWKNVPTKYTIDISEFTPDTYILKVRTNLDQKEFKITKVSH